MGLDPNSITCLLYARTLGVSFSRTAMLGRQLLVSSVEALRQNLGAFGYALSAEAVRALLMRRGGYAEPFFELLGASEIRSFDASDWEQASDVSDFNLPVEEQFKNRFRTVLDGGTLEHVFNFPVAIKNCMEMLEVGGHFLSITPANNFMGHGFYQFSPELFFRVFGEANGFQLVRMILFENRARPEWFEVVDPGAIKQRVSTLNTRPTNLLVIARKVAAVPILAAPPQQSSYVDAWATRRTLTDSPKLPWLDEPTALLRMKRLLRRLYLRFRNAQYPYDPRFFRRIEIPPVPVSGS